MHAKHSPSTSHFDSDLSSRTGSKLPAESKHTGMQARANRDIDLELGRGVWSGVSAIQKL